jgi:Ca2+/Na+ antiporter
MTREAAAGERCGAGGVTARAFDALRCASAHCRGASIDHRAIGNPFGSNLFDTLVIAIDDVAYLKGPLLTNVSQAHALSGVSAMIMTGAAIVGLHFRPETRLFKTAGWISLALVLTYVLNSLVLCLRGL